MSAALGNDPLAIVAGDGDLPRLLVEHRQSQNIFAVRRFFQNQRRQLALQNERVGDRLLGGGPIGGPNHFTRVFVQTNELGTRLVQQSHEDVLFGQQRPAASANSLAKQFIA